MTLTAEQEMRWGYGSATPSRLSDEEISLLVLLDNTLKQLNDRGFVVNLSKPTFSKKGE